ATGGSSLVWGVIRLRRRGLQQRQFPVAFGIALGSANGVEHTLGTARNTRCAGPRYHSPMATETPTRTRYAVLLFVYLAAFITYLDRVCLSVAAPAMQAELGISQVEFAWVFTVFYIAYGVFEMPTAWL